MPLRINLNLDPEQASDEQTIRRVAAKYCRVDISEINNVRIVRRSVDARKKDIRINLEMEIFRGDEPVSAEISPFCQSDVSLKPEVLIVGGGPAGLFAALRLIELGLRPVIIERGREVKARKRDIALISREHRINPDSNYCFGEGGAGTFSDGKLYTRSKKRGNNRRVLELLCLHGADESILYEAHPHLGTDRLPRIITNIRKSITGSGGVFLFENRVTDLILSNRSARGVVINEKENFKSPYIILATGHSARDIYSVLLHHEIELHAKSFAMGLRVEHPQELIDMIQYHGKPRGRFLPAASYNLVRQVEGRGVYSFCMCPGGFIVPAATSQEEIVVNGMSPSSRNSRWANSGIVTEVNEAELSAYRKYREFAGLEFQKELERLAWENGGMTQRAPAQRLTDFVRGKESSTLPEVSYFPGVTPSSIDRWFAPDLTARLQEGFRQFGMVMKGFLTGEAVVVGVESRTSSPLRIPRNEETMEHITVRGLFPCGEGSGYAGGIVSSAVDGMKAAEAVAEKVKD